MKKGQPHIKPQDVLLLLKLLSRDPSNARLTDLSHQLGISFSEISTGISRLREARLVEQDSRNPLKDNAYEFLIHAIKYVFPGKLAAVARGVPTAHSAPPLSAQIKASAGDVYVWPHEAGESRGQSVIPLYPAVPEAALKDPQLYKLLALVDAMRIGRVREQELAQKELQKAIFGKKSA